MVPVGTRFGVYEIAESLGVGAMGEVYRAVDTQLARPVAIKILPEAFGRDADRTARFEREARLLGGLNHPNIATVHGFDEAGGAAFLVMELIPGPTLADSIAQRRIPVEEALDVARQIASALEAAHAAGVVHRDLKPANIKVTPDGTVKVLDFGLAKALREDPPSTDRPTVSWGSTELGTILGTAAYMSPEQARGKTVDERADLWAFGCVVFEMLTGRLAFPGGTTSDILAAILRSEPDWTLLPPDTPPRLVDLLRQCLQKDPARRRHDARDVRLAVEEAAADPPSVAVRPARAAWAPTAIAITGALGVGLLIGMVAAASIWRRPPAPPSRGVARVAVPVDPIQPLLSQGSPVSVSPDGRTIVLVGTRDGATQLYARRLDRLDLEPIAGTTDARSPFFSPDGAWIGFVAAGKLKKIPAGGGAATTLCDALPRGAAWGPDGQIVFVSQAGPGLWRIPASGGEPRPLVDPAAKNDGMLAAFPSVLPDGKGVLYTAWSGSLRTAAIGVQSLESGERRLLVRNATAPVYVASGHLVFGRSDGVRSGLWVAPFDLATRELSGPAVPAVADVRVNESGATHFAVARDGTLVFVAAPAPQPRAMLWVDRSGAARPLTAARRDYHTPRFAPDGRRLAVRIVDRDGARIWIHDIDRDLTTPLTSDDASDRNPVWSPDGRWVAFASARNGPYNIVRRRADGSRSEERLETSETDHIPYAWSRDGRWIVMGRRLLSGRIDLALLGVGAGSTQSPPLQSAPGDRGAALSPDGRFMALASNEAGRMAVFVTRFPATGEKWQVSRASGLGPVWGPEGRELYYREGDDLMVVSLTLTPEFRMSQPRVLFRAPYDEGLPGTENDANYDVSPDGAHFVFLERAANHRVPPSLQVVQNWFEELVHRTSRGSR